MPNGLENLQWNLDFRMYETPKVIFLISPSVISTTNLQFESFPIVPHRVCAEALVRLCRIQIGGRWIGIGQRRITFWWGWLDSFISMHSLRVWLTPKHANILCNAIINLLRNNGHYIFQTILNKQIIKCYNPSEPAEGWINYVLQRGKVFSHYCKQNQYLILWLIFFPHYWSMELENKELVAFS